jgi:3'-5' exoribonuclease
MTTETPIAANETQTHLLLSDLKAKMEVRGNYRISSIEPRRRQDGAEFWKLVLTDRSGEMTTYVWPERCSLDSAYQPNQLVHVCLMTRELNCEVVADVLELTPTINPPMGEVIDLLPAAGCPHPDVLQRLVSIVQGISSPHLRQFVETALTDDDVTLPLLVNPASGQYHHVEPGGLLRHSVETAEAVGKLLSSSFEQEVALVAALFHDIGKARTFNRDGTKTRLGQLVDHDTLVMEICAVALRDLDKANPDAALMLRHVWTASNSPNFGIATQSALVSIVRSADRVSAERDKDSVAFAGTTADCDTARIGRETRYRLTQTTRQAAA